MCYRCRITKPEDADMQSTARGTKSRAPGLIAASFNSVCVYQTSQDTDIVVRISSDCLSLPDESGDTKVIRHCDGGADR